MAESFAQRWNRKSSECGFDDVGIEMAACGADWLPSDAAPYLTFDRASRPLPIWEVYAPADETYWLPADRERLGPYRMIGSDGAGNPICVEQGTGTVVLLNHEDKFRTRQFVNSSVAQLAECLLAFMGERDPKRFRSAVTGIDSTAIGEGSFWWYEAAGLGADLKSLDGPTSQ
jgi:hypothetical protein